MTRLLLLGKSYALRRGDLDFAGVADLVGFAGFGGRAGVVGVAFGPHGSWGLATMRL